MISEQLYPFKQEVDKAAMENAVVVIVVVRYILPDNDLLEEILCDRIAVFVITPLVEFDLYDLFFANIMFKKILIEKVKHQHRFAASSYTRNDLDLAVPHLVNDTVKIIISVNHDISPRIYAACDATCR